MTLNRLFLNVRITAVILAVGVTALATTLVQLPKASEVAGVYFGYATDSYKFLRLELDSDGAGYLSVCYLPADPVRLYRVESWRLSEWNVELQILPLDKAAESVTLRNMTTSPHADPRLLAGEFGGSGWSHKIKLYGGGDWQARAVLTQERIAKYRKEKQ